MTTKVDALAAMVRNQPGLEGHIVSGRLPGAVEAALCGKAVGTVVT
jgi:isopentenyl phosphate kinase